VIDVPDANNSVSMTRRDLLAVGAGVGMSLSLDFSTFAMGQEGGRGGTVPSAAWDDLDAPTRPPPKYASVLFGTSGLANWVAVPGGGPAEWTVKDGYFEVAPRSGDIRTRSLFTDFQLHVEFWLPLMENARGQARANSGVYLQGLYEIQVLDSYGVEPKHDDCGGIYQVAAPLRNACKKPERWQTFDIAFRAPRISWGGLGKVNARVTVFQNDVLIHHSQELSQPTGGGGSRMFSPSKPGPILLQEHGSLVRYRNIWIVEG
jgi:hypothetical protein